jgi:hypothetical protein
MSGKLMFIPPEDPAHASVYQPVFMTGTVQLVAEEVYGSGDVRIDTLDTRNFEVPFDTRGGEGAEKGTGSAVDVNRNVNSGFFFVFIKEFGDL